MKQVQVAVVGASGYTGQELLRILLNHRGVKLVCATSRQYAGQPLWEVFPRFRQVPGSGLKFTDSDVEAIAATGAEVAFLALPHGVAASYARGLVDRGVRVIDLSADFRLDSPEVYEEYYGNPHPDTALMQEAVYGLPEWRREEIARARIVASPGCYPTSILLPLIPLFKAGMLEPEDVVVCSGSGVSGAGRKASIPLLFCECNESFHAYGVKKGADPECVGRLLEEAYAAAPFVRLLGRNQPADTKNVTRTNCVDIGWAYDPRTNRVILMSAEDNVVKGAGGQAVQSFNIMCGFDETEGLWVL